ncbi:hypothetical protein NPIL_152891 [Nephila pilipes]|uniref:Uncharacterized protein n=1 Tax=Nephila pilipes TaxID=299642 RepID=A0A8X6UM42_NEPPI|nr:hypothetical protein NPIL_152891 [Nephila pilipes]
MLKYLADVITVDAESLPLPADEMFPTIEHPLSTGADVSEIANSTVLEILQLGNISLLKRLKIAFHFSSVASDTCSKVSAGPPPPLLPKEEDFARDPLKTISAGIAELFLLNANQITRLQTQEKWILRRSCCSYVRENDEETETRLLAEVINERKEQQNRGRRLKEEISVKWRTHCESHAYFSAQW